MTGFTLSDAANRRLDEIYDYTADRWGEAQADRYTRLLFEGFAAIAARQIPWRAIPDSFGVPGHYARVERHIAYWRQLDDGGIEFVAILHERMHQLEQLRAIWEP